MYDVDGLVAGKVPRLTRRRSLDQMRSNCFILRYKHSTGLIFNTALNARRHLQVRRDEPPPTLPGASKWGDAQSASARSSPQVTFNLRVCGFDPETIFSLRFTRKRLDTNKPT